MGGCAQRPQQLAASNGHAKEYFPASVYGAASRRVVADGQPVPRGGGQYLVGKPYSVAGQTYYPSERKIVQTGNASWYGDAFHGRLTANGEVYDRDGFTAAHPTMPLPSYARVTNLRNRYSMIVRVNDRGPYASNRVMDVSRRVAEALDFKRYGTAPIKVEYVGPASLAGSDDAKLFATLKTDGPARWQDGQPRTLIAEEAPRQRVASVEPYVPLRSRPQPWIEEQRPRDVAAYGEPPEGRSRHPSSWQRDAASGNRDGFTRRSPSIAREESAGEDVAPRPTPREKWAAAERAKPSITAKRERFEESPRPTSIFASRSRRDNEERHFAVRELKHSGDVEPWRSAGRMPLSHASRQEPVEVAAIMPPSRPKGLRAGTTSSIHDHAKLRLARSGE